jgi:hypothetical protein
MDTTIEAIETTPTDATSIIEAVTLPESIAEPVESIAIPQPEPQPEPQSAITCDDDPATESRLTEEISALWSQHIDLNVTRKSTGKELRILRAKLAERLYAMKQLLCRAGRAGQWRGWLKQAGIARSSADRFCERHAETLDIGNADAPSRATEQEYTVEQLVQSLLPRLRSKLADTQAVFKFIIAVAAAFGLNTTSGEDSLFVFVPKPEGSEDSSSPVGAPEVASTDVPSPSAQAPASDPELALGVQVQGR